MMNKPVMQKEVAVRRSCKTSKFITFYATSDAVTEFVDFGRLHEDVDRPNLYWLWVDSRFNFDEVLEYIKSYG